MDWRTSGDTTLEEFRSVLPTNSEIVKRGEVEAVYYSAQPFTRLVLGMLAAESSFATNFNAVPASMKNPLNLRRRGEMQFQSFSSIAACVDEWRERITSPTYKYKDTVTVKDLVEVYAPSFENNVAKYVSTVESTIYRVPRRSTATMSTPFPPPPVEIAITPYGNGNRPKLEMASPSYITVHEVGNQSPGADEEMHKRFVHNGGGQHGVSFHFVVGQKEAIQLIPLDEVAWHASDGYNGTGNRDSVAIETIQIGDFNHTMWNLAWLINELATNPTRFFSNKPRTWDLSIERIKQHNEWAPDQKNCPQFLRDRGLWPELMRRVDVWNAESNPEPEPEPVPEPKHQLPEGKSEALLRRLYGTAKNPVTGEDEGFDLRFTPSQKWLAHGKRTGRWPELNKIIRRGDGGLLYTWADGSEWERKAPGVK